MRDLLAMPSSESSTLHDISLLTASRVQATAEFVTTGVMRAELGDDLYIEFDPSELFFIIKDITGHVVGTGDFSHFLNSRPE